MAILRTGPGYALVSLPRSKSAVGRGFTQGSSATLPTHREVLTGNVRASPTICQASYTPGMGAPLDDLGDLAERRKRNADEADAIDVLWRDAIRRALADDHPVMRIARIAGTTRQTVYAIRDGTVSSDAT